MKILVCLLLTAYTFSAGIDFELKTSVEIEKNEILFQGELKQKNHVNLHDIKLIANVFGEEKVFSGSATKKFEFSADRSFWKNEGSYHFPIILTYKDINGVPFREHRFFFYFSIGDPKNGELEVSASELSTLNNTLILKFHNPSANKLEVRYNILTPSIISPRVVEGSFFIDTEEKKEIIEKNRASLY